MPEGQKCFHITKSVPLELLEGHDGLLKSTFLAVANEVLPVKCKATLQIRFFKKIAKVSFIIYFGYRLSEPKKMSNILSNIVDMTIMKMSINLQTKAFNKLKNKAVKDSLIYKPKEILKIC